MILSTQIRWFTATRNPGFGGAKLRATLPFLDLRLFKWRTWAEHQHSILSASQEWMQCNQLSQASAASGSHLFRLPLPQAPIASGSCGLKLLLPQALHLRLSPLTPQAPADSGSCSCTFSNMMD